MKRCLVVFNLNAQLLEEIYLGVEQCEGYVDIQGVMEKHRFKNIQGTVYLGEQGVSQAHCTLALQEVAIRYAWFEKCVTNVHFYELTDDFNAMFIIDGVTQARLAFDRRIAALRQQLINAGLPLEKASEIVGKQKFSLQDLAPDDIPKAWDKFFNEEPFDY